MPDPQSQETAALDRPLSADSAISTVAPFAADTPPSLPPTGNRYLLHEEIARGGMGVVHRATDTVLGREVAVKVLGERFDDASAAARRFLDEARIAGQLQHPGIPAVHDLGTLPDGRPFLAMKLVKGRTLAALLKELTSPGEERGRFLAVFEQICQAVGYAHAHQVVHRDLKPANIMVGAFGEVQVMDWGLAKVLRDKDHESTEIVPSGGTEIRSLRDNDGSETQAGSVLGTPAYMPPEQAIGAVDRIDARSDVFGLGAVLLVILTGKPPFVADTNEAARQLAARAKLDDAFARLDSCGADPDLVSLCKRCLSPEPNDRPANAGIVARAVADLRAAADERARQAELECVRTEGELRAAELQVAEQRKRRKIQAVLGATFTTLVVLVGLFLWWVQEQRRAHETAEQERRTTAQRKVNHAFEEAVSRYSQARGADRNPALWVEARAAMVQAGAVALAEDAAPELRARIRHLLTEIEQAEKNHQLIATLLDIQASMGDYLLPNGDQDFHRADARYARAFRDYGTDLLQLSPDQGSQLLRNLGRGVEVELAAALDDWAYVQFIIKAGDRGGEVSPHLFYLTRVLDPDPLRNRIRTAIVARNVNDLKAIAEDLDPSVQPVQTINLVAVYLYWFGGGANSIKFLRKAHPYHSGNFQITHNLAYFLLYGQMGTTVSEALSYSTAAIAIRPKSAVGWQDYARALRDTGHTNDALLAYRQLVALAPNHAQARLELGQLLTKKGDTEQAIATYQEAIRSDPMNLTYVEKLADVLFAGRPTVPWTVLQPLEMTATNGGTLRRLPDDSILVGGANPATNSYRIVLATELRGITALRLEALPDPSLPSNGPGRMPQGNFCLTEIALASPHPEAPGKDVPIPLVRATGYRRPVDSGTSEADGPSGAIDGDQTTRWDIHPRVGKATSAYFQTGQACAEPRLIVRLDCRDVKWPQHTLGRFRLSATTSWLAFWQEDLAARAEASQGWTRLGYVYLARGEWLSGLLAFANDQVFKPGELFTLKGHHSVVLSGVYSPDGRRIVSGCVDGTLKIWDAETGTGIRTLKGHSAKVWSGSFSPNGRRIVSGCDDGTLKIWDAETGTELHTLKGHVRVVWDAKFSPDGRRIVSGGGLLNQLGELKLWDAETGNEICSLKGHTQGVRRVSFSPDGQRIVSASLDRTLKVWDATKGTELLSITGHTAAVYGVSFSPDGRRIVSCGEDKTVKVWDAEKGTELRTLKGHTSAVHFVSYSPDGRRIVSCGPDNTVRIWDAEMGTELITLRRDTSGAVESVGFSPDGRTIVAGNSDGTVRVWSAEKGTGLLTLQGHTSDVRSVGFSPDGRRVFGKDASDVVRAWDTVTGQPVPADGAPELPADQRTASHEDARLVATAEGRTVRLRYLDDPFADTRHQLDGQSVLLYHFVRLAEAEKAGDRFAVAFHLEALSRYQPWDATLRLRLRAALAAAPDHPGTRAVKRHFEDFEIARRLRIVPALMGGPLGALLELPVAVP